MSVENIKEINNEQVQNNVQLISIPSSWDETNAIIQQGITYDRKQVHWTTLRQQQGLSTQFSKTLTTTESVKKEVEGILTSQVLSASAIEREAIASFASQLEVLESLVTKLPEDEAARGTKLLEVCKKEIEKAQSNTNNTISTKEFLGQMIFLLDTDPTKALDLSNATYRTSIARWSLQSYIKDATKSSFDNLFLKLSAQEKIEIQLGITDAAAYRTAQLPKIMAKALIGSTGFFNDAIGDLLVEKLLVNEENTYREKVVKTLNKYNTDASLVDLLKAAKAPESSDMEATALIRATLNLSHDTPVTDLHAQRTHLACQLASLEHDTMPEMLRSFHTGKAAADINALLQNSCIERSINGKQTTFRYTLENNETALDQEIRMDAEGTLLNGNGIIQRSIALIRAAKEMGIAKDQINEAISSSIKNIFEGNENLNATTPKAIIAALAKKFSEEQIAEKTKIGNLAFSSATCNPMLQAWENSVTSAGSHQSKIRAQAKILTCVQSALYNEFKPAHSSLAEQVKNTFQDFLVQLNANIKLKLSDDNSKYEILDVQTAEQFKALVIRTINAAIFSGPTEAVSELAVNGMMTLASKLSDFVNSNTFLKLALSHFHAANKDTAEDNLDALDHLPWRAPYGNNHFEFLDAYFEKGAEKLEELTPDSASKLWSQLLEFTRKSEQSQNELVEIISAQNTGSLLANHPSFASRNVSEKSVEECLADYQAEFNASEELIALSEEQRKQIIGQIASHIVDHNLVTVFNQDLVKIRKDLSAVAFRKAVYEIGMRYAPDLNEESKVAQTRELDRFIFKTILSDEQKAALKPVHFADTHLIVDGQNVHLCFYQDPFAKAVRLGLVLADSRGLLPLNQDKWVANKPWLLAKTSVAPVSELS